MHIGPYLQFEGRAEEALEFYRQALGAQLEFMMRYKETPDEPPPGTVPPGSENKVMHMSFKVGETTLMASDGSCTGKPVFQGFSLSYTVDSPEDADRVFNALTAGGQVQLPLTQTFFSPRFGMLTDRFGISWMIYVAPKM